MQSFQSLHLIKFETKIKRPQRTSKINLYLLLKSNTYLVSHCRLYSYTVDHYGKAQQVSPGWKESSSSNSSLPEESESLEYHLGTF